MPELRILPQDITYSAPLGADLLTCLRQCGIFPDAPCGGQGTCGKCTVLVDGVPVSACQTKVEMDMTVTILHQSRTVSETTHSPAAGKHCLLALDLGTTTLACCLLDSSTGKLLSRAAAGNPQISFGADVVTRIRAALSGHMHTLTKLIRDAVAALIRQVCRDAGVRPEQIRTVSLVGNPAMQQLYLGLPPSNLAAIPFTPILHEGKKLPCKAFLSLCPEAEMLVVPNISGYLGGDILAGMLHCGIHRAKELTLLVDIGTNGEMVLGSEDGCIACATAAGPALEGAGIRFGMRATEGAIDRVWLKDGVLRCHVIGGGSPKGICGSGILDAVAALLDAGLLNPRGRLLCNSTADGQRAVWLTEHIYLTQNDIRQVQLAKGAIHAGIRLMLQNTGKKPEDIRRVLLAGAFGSNLNLRSACRIGLLPEIPEDRITVLGNAALSGAVLVSRKPGLLSELETIVRQTRHLDLAQMPAFPRAFADSMGFGEVYR